MKNIHVLPTPNPSSLWIDNDINKLVYGVLSVDNIHNCKNQNIYITNSEEIKEGDWFIRDGSIHKCFRVHKTDIEFLTSIDSVYCGSNTFWSKGFCKKIILTTDVDLIKDGVRVIKTEFLDWFVKNPSCEWVEVQKAGFIDGNTGEQYNLFPRIIIPKEDFSNTPIIDIQTFEIVLDEEPKQVLTEEDIFNQRDIDAVTDYINKETSKEETVEDAAYNEFPNQEFYSSDEWSRAQRTCGREGFIRGSKWQSKKSYTEEEVRCWLIHRDVYLYNYYTTYKNLDIPLQSVEDFIEENHEYLMNRKK